MDRPQGTARLGGCKSPPDLANLGLSLLPHQNTPFQGAEGLKRDCCVAEAFVLTDASEEDPGLVDGLPSLCVKADSYLQTPKSLVGEGCSPFMEVPHPSTPLLTLLSLTSVLAWLMLIHRTVPSSSGHCILLPGSDPTSAWRRHATSTLTPSVCFTPKETAPAGAALPKTCCIFRGLLRKHLVSTAVNFTAQNTAKTGHAGVSTLTTGTFLPFPPCLGTLELPFFFFKGRTHYFSKMNPFCSHWCRLCL